MERNDEQWYDHLYDPLVEGVIDDPIQKLYEQLEESLLDDKDAWRKQILKARNLVREALLKTNEFITDDEYAEHCSYYRESFQNHAKSSFREFLKHSPTSYHRFSLEDEYDRLSVQMDYIKDEQKKLRQASLTNAPDFSWESLLENEEILYSAMMSTLSKIIKEKTSTLIAKAKRASSDHQSNMQPAKWLGSKRQLEHLHNTLIEYGCIENDRGFLDHFKTSTSIFTPIVWLRPFTLLVYLINTLKTKNLIIPFTSIEKFAGNFVKRDGTPCKTYHQVQNNTSRNSSRKPRNYEIIDSIIASLPE